MKTAKLLFIASFIFSSQLVFSAPAPPPSGASPAGGTTGPAGPGCWPPPCVPVDNGIIFLIAAGALFGAKKLYDSQKKEQTFS